MFFVCGLKLSLELPPESRYADMFGARSVTDFYQDEVTDSVLTAVKTGREKALTVLL